MTKEDIRALKRGECSAQRIFLSRYAEGVFAFIARLVSNPQDVEELTQDTLLKALRHIDSYDATRSSLQTWLRRIAYRTAINHLRRPSVATVTFNELTTSANDLYTSNALTSLNDFNINAEDMSDDALQQALQMPDDTMTDYLRQALDYLPPDEQTMVNLFYYDDLPLQEIAEILEVPPGTIATRLHRTRKKLFSIILKLQKR